MDHQQVNASMEGLKSESASKELNEEDVLAQTDRMELVVNALLTLIDGDPAFPEVKDFHSPIREVLHEARGAEDLHTFFNSLSQTRIPRVQLL